MRLIIGALAGSIAIVAATPSSPGATTNPIEAATDAISDESAFQDNSWHIGCDRDSHCRYFQKNDTNFGSAHPVFARTFALLNHTLPEAISNKTAILTFMENTTTAFNTEPLPITAIRAAMGPRLNYTELSAHNTTLAPSIEAHSHIPRGFGMEGSQCKPCDEHDCPVCLTFFLVQLQSDLLTFLSLVVLRRMPFVPTLLVRGFRYSLERVHERARRVEAPQLERLWTGDHNDDSYDVFAQSHHPPRLNRHLNRYSLRVHYMGPTACPIYDHDHDHTRS